MRLAAVAVASASLCIACPASGQILVDTAVRTDIQKRGTSRVIVEIRTPGAGAVSALAQIREVLGAATTTEELDERAVAARIGDSDLERLMADQRVVAVYKDRLLAPALIDTVSLTNASAQWQEGHDGNNVVIAVLDTGIDATHPFFKGKIVVQGCFSVLDPTDGAQPLCPAGVTVGTDVIDTSPASATACAGKWNKCDHGTHVAGIAAGAATLDPAIGKSIAGVAKGAKIAAIQIFSRITDAEQCGGEAPPCIRSYTSSQIRALAYIRSKVLYQLATSDGPRIVAVNLSIGGEKYSAPCDAQDPLTRHIKALADEGVATFAAAGNNSYTDGISSPACISSAIAVGALDKPQHPGDPPKMADFSNRFEDKLVGLVTIGRDVRSSLPGGQYGAMSGTSMATPVAAGAYAILKSAFPDEPLPKVIAALKASGVPVIDPVSQKSLPTIDVNKAYASLAAASSSAKRPAAVQSASPKDPDAMRSTQSARRFIVELPPGKGRDGLSAIQNVSAALASRMNVRSLHAAPLNSDTLTITTSGPVQHGVMLDAMKEVLGPNVGLFIDRPERLVEPLPSEK